MLTKEPKQLVHSHRHVEGRLDHHSLGINYGQKLEARQGPTLPASLPKENLDSWYSLGQWFLTVTPPRAVPTAAAPGNLLEKQNLQPTPDLMGLANPKTLRVEPGNAVLTESPPGDSKAHKSLEPLSFPSCSLIIKSLIGPVNQLNHKDWGDQLHQTW